MKQVKRRGPFLNFSEFNNLRLSNDDLGTMGPLQSAIDYMMTPNHGRIDYRGISFLVTEGKPDVFTRILVKFTLPPLGMVFRV